MPDLVPEAPLVICFTLQQDRAAGAVEGQAIVGGAGGAGSSVRIGDMDTVAGLAVQAAGHCGQPIHFVGEPGCLVPARDAACGDRRQVVAHPAVLDVGENLFADEGRERSPRPARHLRVEAGFRRYPAYESRYRLTAFEGDLKRLAALVLHVDQSIKRCGYPRGDAGPHGLVIERRLRHAAIEILVDTEQSDRDDGGVGPCDGHAQALSTADETSRRLQVAVCEPSVLAIGFGARNTPWHRDDH